ncbi:MAG: hypothetical protein IPL17_18280 [Anaerolineales bacterium]|nr:hypothetical protein [Anaerolineales bacterium]
MIYVIPTFQESPGGQQVWSGGGLSLNWAARYDIVILEDDPYGEMRYSGDVLPPIKYFDKTGNDFANIASPRFFLGLAWVLSMRRGDHQKFYDAKTAPIPTYECGHANSMR